MSETAGQRQHHRDGQKDVAHSGPIMTAVAGGQTRVERRPRPRDERAILPI